MADADTGDHELSPLIQGLAESLRSANGQFSFSDAGLRRFSEAVQTIDEAQREETVAALIALAINLTREVAEGAEPAVEQLSLLADALVGEDRAALLAGAGGPDAGAHAAVTGADRVSKVPVGSGERPSDAVNPMALRLGVDPTKKK